MTKTRGSIATGHTETTKAGQMMLEAGGNAFDAALAALCAACVAEPVLASFGGGGFLLTHQADQAPVLYDFFTQTPKQRNEKADFRPITADFGTATQDFHIGMGSVATPGVVKGLLTCHRDLGRLPLEVIVAPAQALARDGVRVNDMQASVFKIVEAIFMDQAPSRALYAPTGGIAQAGALLKNPQTADFLSALCVEGDDLFYRGDIAKQLSEQCRDHGGHLSQDDLVDYEVKKRTPLRVDYARSHFYTNPAPSMGGTLISFALELVKEAGLRGTDFGSPDHVRALYHIMALTNKARLEADLDQDVRAGAAALLSPALLQAYQQQIRPHRVAQRGTTHISAIDKEGNAASLTLSNGEGCGHLLGNTGIMLNNMLGEEDINPHGFNQWPLDQRMASMMAPTLLIRDDGVQVALGSGGSNRIRTAILQVLVNMLEFGHSLEQAIENPRIHAELDSLEIEAGFDLAALDALNQLMPSGRVWDGKSMFFGGVHGVRADFKAGRFDGFGDPRRDGSAVVVS